MNDSYLFKKLTDLLSIESYSGNEQEVIKYLIEELFKMKFRLKIDSVGNIYATRGKSDAYPLLNAHMDSVKGHKVFTYSNSSYKKFDYSKDFRKCEYLIKGGVHTLCSIDGTRCASAYYCEDYDDGSAPIKYSISEREEEKEELSFDLKYNEKTKELKSNGVRPMGGDDKCGIAIALSIAKTTDIPMKILFTVSEEIGCVGSKHALKERAEWFDDCAYGVTIDRKSGNHICVTTGGKRNASNYFLAELTKWAIISNITPDFVAGTSSDNAVLRALVPNFVNVSAGYYLPHSNQEYVKFDEVRLIKNWIKNFITKGEYNGQS